MYWNLGNIVFEKQYTVKLVILPPPPPGREVFPTRENEGGEIFLNRRYYNLMFSYNIKLTKFKYINYINNKFIINLS